MNFDFDSNSKPAISGASDVKLVVACDQVKATAAAIDVKLGDWMWVKSEDDAEMLACVTKIGSNYIGLSRPSRHGETTWRVHLDDFWRVLRAEPNGAAIVAGYQRDAAAESKRLMGEVSRLMASLGMADVGRLSGPAAPSADGRALVVAAAGDAAQYRDALALAKEKTLPQLLKEIEHSNELMIQWAKGSTLGMVAEADAVKGYLGEIDARIETVGLYAGIGEDVETVQAGSPAPAFEKLHVMQQRLYMDEECLSNYEAGGMTIEEIEDFDRWLLKPENLTTVLPFPRCVVAFRVRRTTKDRGGIPDSISAAFVRIALEKADKLTFLYVRNGEQVHRVATTLELGEKIFPARAEFDPAEPLFAEMFAASVKRIITQGEYEALKAKGDRFYDYEPFDPSSVYYDEIAAVVKARVQQYNRVAVIIQGLFDRAEILHPHGPVRTWEPASFAAAIELVYDGSDALHHGEAPDFEAYRAECNRTLAADSIVVGQELAWMRREQDRENEKRDADFLGNRPQVGMWWKPYGDPGPGVVGPMDEWRPRARQAVFRWKRESKRWDGAPVGCTLTVAADDLLNVSAYKPGDFKRFYADRRTRRDYLKWAPLLLAAEDYHAGRVREPRMWVD